MSAITHEAKVRACELANDLGEQWSVEDVNPDWSIYALAQYIQQASDAAKDLVDYIATNGPGFEYPVSERLAPFILPEPVDPLVEAIHDALAGDCDAAEPTDACLARHIRKALAKRGLKIVETNHG